MPRREIDARGMIVSPGFIDLHTHCDLPFKLVRGLPLPGSFKANLNYITQGVTSVVSGNCGSGYGGEEVSAWLDRIDKMPFGTNVIQLCPYGTVRVMVIEESASERPDQKPTPAEMAEIKRLLDEAMTAGAWGMATGLEYDPSARAETEELIEANRVVARHGGIYASHTRHEGPDPESMLKSYAEAIRFGEEAGTRVQISHIKRSGKTVHGMSGQVIELVEQARARGVKVVADQYPYPAGSATLSYLVPVQFRDGTKVQEQYCTSEGRKKLYPEVKRVLETEIPPEDALVSLNPWKPWLQNKTVAQIAEERGQDPVETAIDLACGIPERGRLERGYYADVVVLDPRTIKDLATFEEPCQFSEGLEYVMVNGVLSIDQGEYTGKRGGRALRHNE